MELVTVANDAVEAVLLPEAGARLHRLRAFGHDVLRTPDDPAEHLRDPFFWGAYVMAPWCNRIVAGQQHYGDVPLDLVSNFPDGSAIHGQVYVRRWEGNGAGGFVTRGGGGGWPWSYEVGLRVEAFDASLRIALALTNRSDEPMPGGLGLHPWFREPVRVAVHGAAVYESNSLGATPAPGPARGRHDLRRIGPMAPGLDATWTDVSDPAVELQWPDLGVRAAMHVVGPTVHIVAASPVGFGAIAVEPQTHAPNGLRRLIGGSPGAMALLLPGADLRLALEFVFREDSGGPSRRGRR